MTDDRIRSMFRGKTLEQIQADGSKRLRELSAARTREFRVYREGGYAEIELYPTVPGQESPVFRRPPGVAQKLKCWLFRQW